jgi:hypothetical protein
LGLLRVNPIVRSLLLVVIVLFLSLYFITFYSFWLSYFIGLLFLRGVLIITVYISTYRSLFISSNSFYLFFFITFSIFLLPNYSYIYIGIWVSFTYLGIFYLMIIIRIIYLILLFLYLLINSSTSIRLLNYYSLYIKH